jgi:hypothetical protein
MKYFPKQKESSKYLRTFNLSAIAGILEVHRRMGDVPQPGRWIMEWGFAHPGWSRLRRRMAKAAA